MKKDITDELAEVMFSIARLMKTKMSFSCSSMHLSILQMKALGFIKKNNKVTMTDIAKYFDIELPSATSLLNKLYDLKLVERLEDKEDRRLVRVSLTDTGKAWLKQAKQQHRQKALEMLSYLSEEEKNKLLGILKTLKDRLQS